MREVAENALRKYRRRDECLSCGHSINDGHYMRGKGPCKTRECRCPRGEKPET